MNESELPFASGVCHERLVETESKIDGTLATFEGVTEGICLEQQNGEWETDLRRCMKRFLEHTLLRIDPIIQIAKCVLKLNHD